MDIAKEMRGLGMSYKYTEKENASLLESLGCKVCSGCNKELPKSKDFFYKNKTSKDGFFYKCKDCERVSAKLRHERNKERNNETSKRWKEENKERVKAYRDKNKERDADVYKEWSKTSRGRELNVLKLARRRSKMRSLEFNFNLRDWENVLRHFNNECCYCGIGNQVLEKEHLLPLVSGGTFTRDNILPACRSCNASKRNREFREWYKKSDNYSIDRERKILEYVEMRKNNALQIHR